MWQGGTLRMLHIIEQRPRRTNSDFKARTTKAIEVVSIKLFGEGIEG